MLVLVFLPAFFWRELVWILPLELALADRQILLLTGPLPPMPSDVVVPVEALRSWCHVMVRRLESTAGLSLIAR
jgi:hypothetical protein